MPLTGRWPGRLCRGALLTPVVLTLASALTATRPALAHPVAAPTAAPAPEEVARLYQSDCAVCHGAEGRGTNRGPTLMGVGRASVDYWVSTGRMPLPAVPGTQQPRRRPAHYRPEVVTAMVDYVTALGGPGPEVPPVDPRAANVAEGGELFRLQCAACHAWAGDGGALLDREAPSLHPPTATQIAEAIRVGPGAMPAFGQAALNDDALQSVVAYVRYLDAPRDRGGNPLWHLGPVAEGGIAWVVGIGLLLLALRWIGERT
jgi:ubiquinol-cytochrome c reductase cytochrome c subunit